MGQPLHLGGHGRPQPPGACGAVERVENLSERDEVRDGLSPPLPPPYCCPYPCPYCGDDASSPPLLSGALGALVGTAPLEGGKEAHRGHTEQRVRSRWHRTRGAAVTRRRQGSTQRRGRGATGGGVGAVASVTASSSATETCPCGPLSGRRPRPRQPRGPKLQKAILFRPCPKMAFRSGAQLRRAFVRGTLHLPKPAPHGGVGEALGGRRRTARSQPRPGKGSSCPATRTCPTARLRPGDRERGGGGGGAF